VKIKVSDPCDFRANHPLKLLCTGIACIAHFLIRPISKLRTTVWSDR